MPRFLPAALLLIASASVSPVLADEGALPAATAPAPDRAAALEAENAQLKVRLDALEAENAALRKRLEQAPGATPKAAEEAKRLAEENVQLKKQLDLTATQRQDLVVENKRLEELAGLTAKGDKVESAAALIKSRYVAEESRTVVTSVPERLTMDAGVFDVPHLAWFEYGYAGEEMTQKPEKVAMYVAAAGNTREKYKHAEALRVTLDGETLSLPIVSYESSSESSAASRVRQKRYKEIVRVDLDAETLRKFARGRQATAEMSGVTVELPAEVLATAKAVRERIEIGR